VIPRRPRPPAPSPGTERSRRQLQPTPPPLPAGPWWPRLLPLPLRQQGAPCGHLLRQALWRPAAPPWMLLLRRRRLPEREHSRWTWLSLGNPKALDTNCCPVHWDWDLGKAQRAAWPLAAWIELQKDYRTWFRGRGVCHLYSNVVSHQLQNMLKQKVKMPAPNLDAKALQLLMHKVRYITIRLN
jgi:hypothetical protein